MPKLKAFIESSFIQYLIICVIILDSAVLGALSLQNLAYEKILLSIDYVCLYLFILEMIIKILAFQKEFFKSKWNLFDLVIIILSILPMFGNFLIFRLFRILKMTRLFSAIPQLRFIIAVMLKTLPSAMCIGIIMLIIFYIYAVLGVQLFSKEMPTYFGTLSKSLFSLFQVMSGDSWAESIARAALEFSPFSWIYFVSFIIISGFIVLNMVIGIIVDSINEIKSKGGDDL